jgi:hypothetical protein
LVPSTYPTPNMVTAMSFMSHPDPGGGRMKPQHWRP